MYLAHWYVVLVCHKYAVCKLNYVGSGYVGDLSESGLCVFRELSPVSCLWFVKVCRFCCSLMIVRVELSTMSGCTMTPW